MWLHFQLVQLVCLELLFNDTMLILLIVLGILLRTQSNHPVFWLMAWPGTAFHELSHYVVGFLLGARPTQISILPSTGSSGNQVHGYVEFDNLSWYNALPTALAPLLGFIAAMMLATKLTWAMTWTNVALWWVCVAMISQCWPSNADWKVAFCSPVGLVFYGALATAVVVL